MNIGGLSLILILGLLNLVLVLFQLSTGMRWVKVPFKVHKTSGIVLVVSAVVHGLLAALAELL
jgi:hypothetical protein